MNKYKLGEVIKLVSMSNQLICLGVIDRIKTKFYHITWIYQSGFIHRGGALLKNATDNNEHINHYTNSMVEE